ncbi:MAG: hypothetical protein GWP08_03040 [Nitrospiraceae bacterium]|nr:hypothetical protein [Nitrospiraceae bacterium]
MTTPAKIVLACSLALVALAARAQIPDLTKLDLVMRSVPDGPVAKVNGVNITREEFVGLYQNKLASIMMRLQSTNVPDRVRLQTGLRAVGILVQRELLFQAAVERGLKATDAEVEERWADELKGLKKFTAKDEAGEINESEILERAGTSREQVIEQLRKAILIEKMRDAIAKDKGVAVSEAEVTKFYNENKDLFKRPSGFHLRQIFTSKGAGAGLEDAPGASAARKKAEQALARIQAGESFESVAKALSEAPDRSRGGDMGPQPVTALPPFLTEAAAAMQPGDLSEIIESDLGFHIIELVKPLPGGDISLDMAGPRIRSLLLENKKGEAINAFCDPYADKPGYVQVFLQLEKVLATEPGFEDIRQRAAEQSGAGN